MGKDLDGVRQVLEAVLRSLRDEPSSGASISLVGDGFMPVESKLDAPVIVIVANGLKAQSQETNPSNKGDANAPVRLNTCVSDYPERKVSHPGLERFIIEAESLPSAPKACFMEPGRPCVNSGACEMRGF